MPWPRSSGAVVALQAPVEPADDLPLEAAQDPFGCQRGGGFHIARWSAEHARVAEHDLGQRDRGEDGADDVVRRSRRPPSAS